MRDHEDRLGLTARAEFPRFIERDFAFYRGWYERLRQAAEDLVPGLECVHFNAQHNFTLQYPVLLAPLRTDDVRRVVPQVVELTPWAPAQCGTQSSGRTPACCPGAPTATTCAILSLKVGLFSRFNHPLTPA